MAVKHPLKNLRDHRQIPLMWECNNLSDVRYFYNMGIARRVGQIGEAAQKITLNEALQMVLRDQYVRDIRQAHSFLYAEWD